MFKLRTDLNKKFSSKQSEFKSNPTAMGRLNLDSLSGHVDALSLKIFKAEIEAYNYLADPTKNYLGNLAKYQWKLEGEKSNAW